MAAIATAIAVRHQAEAINYLKKSHQFLGGFPRCSQRAVLQGKTPSAQIEIR